MVSQDILKEAVHRLVDKFHPEKIILFGSQACGTADSRSDVDLLIISPIKEKRRKLMVEMIRALSELEYAFDVIILTREEFERDQRSLALLEDMHQGKVRSFMSIPDQDHINRVLLWMSYADEDLDLANYAMKMPGIRSYRLIAFHAQ